MEHSNRSLIIFLLIIVIIILSCNNKYFQSNGCDFKAYHIEMAVEQQSENNNIHKNERYLYIVFDNIISNKCFDSTMIFNIAKKIVNCDTNLVPIRSIAFYNKNAEFIKGETCQLWSKLNKYCLIEIYFIDSLQIGYIHYNDDGTINEVSSFTKNIRKM